MSTRVFIPLLCCVGFAATANGQSADTCPTGLVASAVQPHAANRSAVPGPGSYSALLYDNGDFITGGGNGFGGASTSSVEVGFNTYGYGLYAPVPLPPVMKSPLS